MSSPEASPVWNAAMRAKKQFSIQGDSEQLPAASRLLCRRRWTAWTSFRACGEAELFTVLWEGKTIPFYPDDIIIPGFEGSFLELRLMSRQQQRVSWLSCGCAGKNLWMFAYMISMLDGVAEPPIAKTLKRCQKKKALWIVRPYSVFPTAIWLSVFLTTVHSSLPLILASSCRDITADGEEETSCWGEKNNYKNKILNSANKLNNFLDRHYLAVDCASGQWTH